MILLILSKGLMWAGDNLETMKQAGWALPAAQAHQC